MTLMQLIKLVLDEAYLEIPGLDAAKDAEIKKSLSILQKSYKDLKNPNRQAIDYTLPQVRFAYIYKYTVAHADYIQQLINSSPELLALFKTQSVSVACVGGGPGSDLLGILKYMILSDSKSTLTCYLFDRERAWGDSWSEVAKPLDLDFKLYPVFQQMDITDQIQWSSYRKFLNADLFSFSYFLSEVWSFKDKAAPFFEHSMKNAKSGSLFMFIDNNDEEGEFPAWFDAMAVASGVKMLVSKTREMAFALDEEKKDLEPYFSKFDWPKRRSNVAIRVGKKV